MADITNPILTAFVRDVARPAAEIASLTKVNIDLIYDKWNAQIEPLLVGLSDADVLVEGRNDLIPLTVGDLKALFASLNRLRLANTTPQRRDITKARVRVAQVEG